MIKRMFLCLLLVCFLVCVNRSYVSEAQAGNLVPCQGEKTGQAFVLTQQVWVVTSGTSSSTPPGDIEFLKTSLSFDCHYDWALSALTVNCKDGPDSFSAVYNFAYIETDLAKGRTDKIMVYVWGDYHLTVDGYPMDGSSTGFLSGTEKKDSSGNITSISLNGNLYGGIDGDSIFQGNVRVSMTPKE